MEYLKSKHVLVGVTGGIAAYKACELLRLLRKAGASVEAAMTPSAREFIGPASLQALSGRPVLASVGEGGSPDAMDHIAAARRADLMIIAPATATTIGKIASGIADNAVTALACATTAPLLLAPAMNVEMWANPGLQRSLGLLRADGRSIVEPGAGELACGEYGPGRMAEPAQIAAHAASLLELAQRLAEQDIVVTVGATAEAIDDMRVVSNRSSGRMGMAMAAAAREAGARVHLLAAHASAPVPGGMASVTHAGDARSMHEAALDLAAGASCFIGVAAVSDYRPAKAFKGKIPRKDGGLKLELEPCEDVIATVAKRRKRLYCLGFAAEASELPAAIKAARRKLKSKGLDAIVASPLARNLESDACELALVRPRGHKEIAAREKLQAAREIIAQLPL